jgi:hypothetical protein
MSDYLTPYSYTGDQIHEPKLSIVNGARKIIHIWIKKETKEEKKK